MPSVSKSLTTHTSGAVICGVLSAVLFCWPVSRRAWRFVRELPPGETPSNPRPWSRRIAEIRQRYIPERQPYLPGERELLDYVVEGPKALNDAVQILAVGSKETIKIGRVTQWFTWRLNLTNKLAKRRHLIGKVAAYMNAYSDKMADLTEIMSAIRPVIRENQIGTLEHSVIASKDDYDELIKFARILRSTASTARTTIGQLVAMRQGADGLRGISGELNSASGRVSFAIDSYNAEIEEYAAMCEEVEALAVRKVAEVAARYELSPSATAT